MMESLVFQTQAGDYELHAHVVFCGQDVAVVVGGGTRPHVGAVGVAVSHPSLKDPSVHTTTPSVITIPGHKETQIALDAANQLARALDTTVVVSVGIHVDDAPPELIGTLVRAPHSSPCPTGNPTTSERFRKGYIV
jgi:hypothetical protein